MEKDQRKKKLASTSSDSVLGEAAATAKAKKEKVVYASEEQFVSVFSNGVVSFLSFLN